jgi:hypothetical protein
MRMLHGDINVYWYHDELTPHTVRAATYGTAYDSGALIPDVGDVIRDFHGYMGEPITVRVTEVKQFGDGVVAFEVHVATVGEEG